MEFIADNYIWFIVGGIVLLMTFIGYIAEKTDFGKQKFASKTHEPKPKKEKKIKDNKKTKKNDNINAELKAEEVEPIEVEPLISNGNEEDLNAPFGDVVEEIKPIEPVIIEEDLEVPLNSEVTSVDNKINDLPLPEIDTLNNNVEDEDVWKF